MEGIWLTGSFLTTNSSRKLAFLASDDFQSDNNADDTTQLMPTTAHTDSNDDDDVTLETLPPGDNEFLENISDGEEYDKASARTADTIQYDDGGAATDEVIITDVASSDDDAPYFADLPTSLTLNLLEDCIVNNPVAALNNHYMKQGVQNDFKSSFREDAFQMPGRATTYRTCTFVCPIKGTVYNCTLPKCILDKEVDESLVQAVQRAFGDFVETHNGQVVFSTKKGAKRCVAMVALYELRHSCDINQTNTDGVRVTATNGVGRRADPPQVAAKSKHTPFLSKQDLNRRAKYLKRIKSTNQFIPSWVDDLNRTGVRASHLKISYQGEASEAGWNCTPTLIRCVLEIDEPSACTITGNPLTSKELALENAAVGLCDCLRRLKLVDLIDERLEFDFEERQRLLACDSTVEVNYTSIPAWGRDRQDRLDINSCVTWYLYKIDFVTASGASFVAERSGMEESIAAPLGIVFPKCISPLEFVIIQRESDAMNEVTLRLSKLGTVSIDEARRSCLKEFNLSLDQWKRYSKEEAMRLNGKITATMQGSSSPQDYTYYFVPLKGGQADQIDLDLLDKVTSKTGRAYMEPHPWSIFCRDLLTTMKFLCALLLISLLASIFGEAEIQTTVDDSRNAMLLSSLFTMTAMLHLLSVRYPMLMTRLGPDILQNHFLVQKGVNNTVYVAAMNAFADGRDNLTGLSPMPGSAETYADHYKNRYNVPVYSRSESLIPSKVATSNSKNDFLLRKEPIGDTAALIPELVWLLPMPLHYLYLARHTEKCMARLEREIELSFAYTVVRRLTDGNNDNSTTSVCCLSSLLGEATTLVPKPTYQRLEFLGDSVLGFYFTVVLFATNSELVMTYDDVGACLEQSVKNDTLFSAALRIGANRLLFTSQRQRKWRVEHSGDYECESIPDSIMSDAVESLLGATFVYDSANQESSTSVALFEMLRLPISSRKTTKTGSISSIDAILSCMHNGYPFERDGAWMKQLAALNESMTCDQGIAKELREKHHALVTILSVHDTVSINECNACKILVTAALFHDDEIDSMDESKCAMENLLRLSRFRDMLFFVGAYALQLCITTDLYHRFPGIDEGGLHILRARAISDDTVVYIMFKAGIHKTVYNLNKDIMEDFEAKMIKADTLGMQDWQARGGWVLPGGMEEFARRRRISSSETLQYPGFSGGRLFGNENKLDLKYTEEPMFVMKAIIGALVLSNGMHQMWNCIGPFFEEVLLLSPEESLEAYPESTIK